MELLGEGGSSLARFGLHKIAFCRKLIASWWHHIEHEIKNTTRQLGLLRTLAYIDNSEGQSSTKLHDKRDDFSLCIVNF